MFEDLRARGGRRLFAVGCSVLGVFDLGAATGAHEASLLIGCFIQLVTEAESALRRRAESPRFESLFFGRPFLLMGQTTASKPPSPWLLPCSKATHSETPAALKTIFLP